MDYGLGDWVNREPARHALAFLDQPTVTFKDLGTMANQLAHLFRTCGIGRGDHVATQLSNGPHVLAAVWGACCAGAFVTPVANRFSAPEISYVVDNRTAKVILCDAHYAPALKQAIHAAAPCSTAIKSAMIDWWGPILEECYAGTERVGLSALTTAEWLKKPGSIGTARKGQIRIVSPEFEKVGANETGAVSFRGTTRFAYFEEPEKPQPEPAAKGIRLWVKLVGAARAVICFCQTGRMTRLFSGALKSIRWRSNMRQRSIRMCPTAVSLISLTRILATARWHLWFSVRGAVMRPPGCTCDAIFRGTAGSEDGLKRI